MKIDDVALNAAFWTHKKSGVQISSKTEIPLEQMNFRPKPWYFEVDCPVCTRSASSYYRNPLNFLAHAMWVKLWYHAKFQPFQISFAVLFNFRVILGQNKSSNPWKIVNEVRKGLKSDDVASNGVYWKQKKSRVKICLKNEIPF